jgi:hypothetical protein
VRHVHRIKLSDLRGIDKQIANASSRTRASSSTARPANNVLLTGARGTGKSSIVKGLLHKYSKQGLRPDRSGEERPGRPAADRRPGGRPQERFLVFCDDLSFHGAEDGYIALKVALDGSISTTSDNMLIYATSNRPPPDAGVHGGEPRDQVRRRRDPSGRDGGGEDLALRALRPVGHVLSFRPGRVPRHRRAMAQALRPRRRAMLARGSAAVVAAARLAQRARRLPVRTRLGRPPPEEK